MHEQFRSAADAAPDNDLVLENYGQDYAWLKPCREQAEPDDALYVISDKGRRDLRMAELFGPWPNVACQP